MQIKVEEFFRRTRLMLVIDEAHYLWPQHQRSHSTPELVDWVNTALVNQRVPVALICTDQFAKMKARVEKRTGWTSEQLEHRVKRYKKLPGATDKRRRGGGRRKVAGRPLECQGGTMEFDRTAAAARFRQGDRWLCPYLQIAVAGRRRHV